MKKDATIRPNFHLPLALHNKFKKKCVLLDMSMQECIIMLIKIVGLAREPVPVLSIHPQPLLILGALWAAARLPHGCAAPFCVQSTSPAASSLGPHIFPVSCIIFPRCTDKNQCLAQGHCAASAFWSPGSRLECCAQGSVCGCSWGDKERIVLTPLCCRALVSYSFFFYCAKICITSILTFL